MLQLLVGVFLAVIFLLYFLSLNTSRDNVVLMIIKMKGMNGNKVLFKAIGFFLKEKNTIYLQK